MKITEVRAVQPIADNSPPDWRTTLGQILVAVDTDVGLTGYGVGGGGAAGLHVVRTVLRDVLLEQEPLRITDHWQTMYEATLAFGRKGLAIMALSGVDLALWDLRGKAERQPVARLLGGAVGAPIPVYATVWDDIPAELVEQYPAFKLHVGRVDAAHREEEVLRRAASARQTLGPERALMLDAWMKWTVEQTIRLARKLVPYQLTWIEEPLSPDDLHGYAALREQCPIPIAGGEHEFTAIGFAPLIEQRLHQILQPDVCWCGGLTQLIEIYRLAQQAQLRVCPHRGAEPWALHAIAALDAKPLAESGRPWLTWVGGQAPIVDGTVQLTEQPGFGVSIDEMRLPIRC